MKAYKGHVAASRIRQALVPAWLVWAMTSWGCWSQVSRVAGDDEDIHTEVDAAVATGERGVTGSPDNGFGGAGSPSRGDSVADDEDLGTGDPDPPTEVCYALRNHGEPVPGDSSPFRVHSGERYVEFYFDVPWREPSVMVGFRTLHDQEAIVRHWTLFQTESSHPDGHFQEGIGVYWGDRVEALANWTAGGDDERLPPGLGLVLPPPGGKLMIEWHYFNGAGRQFQDRSGVEICVVPASSIDTTKVASLSWLGSESLTSPPPPHDQLAPGSQVTVQEVCTPSYDGLADDEPVRILAFAPRMRMAGRHMRTWVARRDGMVEKVFDAPFQFHSPHSYAMDPMIELYPGDRLVNECTFDNTGDRTLSFGPSLWQELCYQLAYAYPARALTNRGASVIGDSNVCWDHDPRQAARLIALARE